MFVYWGGNDGGKSHMKHYAIHNDKTQLLWNRRNKKIQKTYSTVHYQGVYWIDEPNSKIIYPETEIIPVAENYYGDKILDNYRWLEDDMSEKTKDWVERQLSLIHI